MMLTDGRARLRRAARRRPGARSGRDSATGTAARDRATSTRRRRASASRRTAASP